MPRAELVTADNVERVITKIVRDGRKPTIRAIRQELGGGSPNTIQPYLAAWKAKRFSEVAVEGGENPNFGSFAELNTLIYRVLQAEISRTSAALQARIVELEKQLAVEKREVERWQGIAAEAGRIRDQERSGRIRAEREAASLNERLSQNSDKRARAKT